MQDRKTIEEKGSFRDASGFVFYYDGVPYRAISNDYRNTYEALRDSGLFLELTDKKYLISHKEIQKEQEDLFREEYKTFPVYKIIAPEIIPFISYPYEWSFSQLKSAAILTLKIQEIALKYNMTLKDASAYNIQFIGANPVFIDTLSFEELEEGKPWVGYKQFCQHFLAPLALAKHTSVELQKLNLLYVDGIPLKLASKLLPFSTYFSSLLALHIHSHAKFENKYSDRSKSKINNNLKLSKKKQLGIVQHLLHEIELLDLKPDKSQWVDYYDDFSYSNEAIEEKKTLVTNWVKNIQPGTTWDIGCNTGLLSEIAALTSGYTVAFDTDYFSVEKFYRRAKDKKYGNILPLVLDVTNPSSPIGWANSERKTLAQRGPADLILALALIHHLSISNNIPFSKVAEYFSLCAENLIIEFVPKSDPQAQRLLVTRNDVFHEYDLSFFKSSFSKFYHIIQNHKISGTDRELFLMKKLTNA